MRYGKYYLIPQDGNPGSGETDPGDTGNQGDGDSGDGGGGGDDGSGDAGNNSGGSDDVKFDGEFDKDRAMGAIKEKKSQIKKLLAEREENKKRLEALEKAEAERKKAEMSDLERAEAEKEELQAQLNEAIRKGEEKERIALVADAGIDKVYRKIVSGLLKDELTADKNLTAEKYFETLRAEQPALFSKPEAPKSGSGHQSQGGTGGAINELDKRIDALMKKGQYRTMAESLELRQAQEAKNRIQKQAN